MPEPTLDERMDVIEARLDAIEQRTALLLKSVLSAMSAIGRPLGDPSFEDNWSDKAVFSGKPMLYRLEAASTEDKPLTVHSGGMVISG